VKTDHTDNYHGNDVPDPYRWLEEDVRENTEVAAWVARQNATTFAYLESIAERDRIAARMRKLWDYERYGLPVKKGGHYFYEYNDGLQNQNVLYRQSSFDSAEEVLIDPNTWASDGTVAMAAWFPSEDGNKVAYLVQDGGSDWRIAKVLDVASGAVLPDSLEWLKFTGLAWAKDGEGFYYSRYPATASGDKFQSLNTDQAVYFHRIGNSQDKDTLVYARPDHPDWGFGAELTDDGRYLVTTIWKGTDDRYQIAVRDLARADSETTLLIEGFDHDYTLAGSRGTELYFRTTNEAPRGRLVAIDIDKPQPSNWREVIPQTENVLKQINLVGGRFIAEYMQDAWSLVRIFDTGGKVSAELDLPGIGTASGFTGSADDPETFFIYESFNTPATINRMDAASGDVSLFKKARVDFDSDDFVVEQVFYTSKDGTRVPMFVAHHKDLQKDGRNPTVLYGYGGFNISLQPGFSVTQLSWMEMGGIWAVANLRGGGEYGEEWHKAGTKLCAFFQPRNPAKTLWPNKDTRAHRRSHRA
jgi:prolyl oligopeptidase